jgi:hypothetical protein
VRQTGAQRNYFRLPGKGWRQFGTPLIINANATKIHTKPYNNLHTELAGGD